MLRTLAVVLLTGPLLAGCFGSPNPLDPTVGGSIGMPHRGTLEGAAELKQKGDGYRRFRKDGIRYGHPRLVAAIEQAARAVAEKRPGPDLVVADLSAEHGGKIARHRSHRTGRDADLLLYVKTADGRPVTSPGFLRFGPDGLAEHDGEFLQLDVERNWLLVKELASDDEALVQWLFVARWVEALLTEHALALGEDDEVIRRANKLLRQPGDSAAHDDHIHMRIACTPDETAAGCISGGYRWDWLPSPRTSDGLSDEQLLSAMFAPVPLPEVEVPSGDGS
ncbi:MAG TPA: murein endopeptidase [Polyangiaceae bacterium]|nr:murein endopeptidase [Polyangiaceae bacterium]